MVLDIKMCRFDNRPWGFRLVGGSDFEYPLTVVKVTEGSIAEEAGLREDDVIVRINDTPTSPLTHEEADHLIRSCGNVFYFGIQRENELSEVPKFFPISETEYIPTAEINNTNVSKSPSICISNNEEETNLENKELMTEEPKHKVEQSLSPIPQPAELEERQEPEPLEEEVEIAAVLSGESEVLKEHNVLGIFPKPGVCMSSDVLRTLNEEAIKTKAEKDKENKKWTTFLQRPDRPIPKSKQQLEAERRAANAYKVQIIKSAPRTPERGLSPAVEIPPSIPAEPEPIKESTPPEPEVEEAPPTDSEVPNLEELELPEKERNEVEPVHIDGEEKADKEKETTPECKEAEADNNPEKTEMTEEQSVESPKSEVSPVKEVIAKTAEELALERQLADVQRQLAALSNLPSTIQTTLDAVTRQLAEILPAFKLQQQPQLKQQQNTESEAREINLEKIDEYKIDEENNEDNNQEQSNSGQQIDNTEAVEARIEQNNDSEVEAYSTGTHEASIARKDDATYMEDEQSIKKQKKNDVIEELEEHLERKNNPKRSKRAFGPLVPSSERPLILPGGRRWYRPKDAYNDEFIAETLSAQAELITGHTLGTTFESPLLGYDPRVNFMKYQKPEKKIDLNKSEVYKVIHHLDRQPVRGIEVRPPVVPAEVDIRKAVE